MTTPETPENAKNLIGLSREQLAAEMAAIGEKPFRVKQVWHWLYHRGVTDIAQMSTLSKAMREKLAQAYYVGRPQVVRHQVSEDRTQKWLLKLDGGHLVESVHIPEDDRGALCISSQVGCTLTCTFCHTGTQRLVRNLEPSEIVAQILLARDRIGDWPGATAPGDGRLLPSTERKISNVVLMGMGEPLYNFDNVKEAMDVAADGDGLLIAGPRFGAQGMADRLDRARGERGVDDSADIVGLEDLGRGEGVSAHAHVGSM